MIEISTKILLVFLVSLIISGLKIWRVIKRLRFNYKFERERNERLFDVNYKLGDELKSKDRTMEKLEISLKNLENALEFKNTEDFRNHLFVSELVEGQKIVILIEVEVENSDETQQKLINLELSPAKFSRKIECVVFVDGKEVYPLLMDDIFAGQKEATIGDINCENYKNRGIGTFVIKNLCTVLNGMGIGKVHASLSSVDFQNKDKLYRFYLEYNDFDLDKELTKEHWGKVSKIIS